MEGHLLQRIIEKSSIIIALCAVCTLATFSVYFDQNIDSFYYYLLFCGSYLAYDFFRHNYKKNRHWLYYLLLISLLIGAVDAFWEVSAESKLKVGILALLTFFYKPGIPFLNPIREIPFLKTIVITIVWMGMCTLPFSLKFIITHSFFWSEFIFVFILVLPFDYFDRDIDGFSTLIKIVGIEKMRFWIMVILVLICFVNLTLNTPYFLHFYFVALILAFLVYFWDRWEEKWEQYLLFDGLLILQFLFLLGEKALSL